MLGELFLDMLDSIHGRGGVGDTLSIINESGLTVPQLITLHILHDHGSRSISELAKCTNLSCAATSHLVERLVRQGLVERTEDDKDRRQKSVSPSALGVKLMNQLSRERKNQFRAGFQCLTPKTRELLTNALRQALNEIKASTVNEATNLP
jgi:DNA-binding MarR family transcriptional regulator